MIVTQIIVLHSVLNRQHDMNKITQQERMLNYVKGVLKIQRTILCCLLSSRGNLSIDSV